MFNIDSTILQKENVSQGSSIEHVWISELDVPWCVRVTRHEGPPAWQRDANATTDSAKLRYVRRFNERVGAPVLCRDQGFVSKFSDIQTWWTSWRISSVLIYSNACHRWRVIKKESDLMKQILFPFDIFYFLSVKRMANILFSLNKKRKIHNFIAYNFFFYFLWK